MRWTKCFFLSCFRMSIVCHTNNGWDDCKKCALFKFTLNSFREYVFPFTTSQNFQFLYTHTNCSISKFYRIPKIFVQKYDIFFIMQILNCWKLLITFWTQFSWFGHNFFLCHRKCHTNMNLFTQIFCHCSLNTSTNFNQWSTKLNFFYFKSVLCLSISPNIWFIIPFWEWKWI